MRLSGYLQFVSEKVKDAEDKNNTEEFGRLINVIIDTLTIAEKDLKKHKEKEKETK